MSVIANIYSKLFAKSTHSHAISDVTALQSSIDSKANNEHTHVKANITDLDIDSLVARIATLENAGSIGFPDYSNQTDIKDAYNAVCGSTGYTITANGWIFICISTAGVMRINGNIATGQSDAGLTNKDFIPVSAGDVLSGNGAADMYFYPCK